jgi:hypothetical protein
MKRSSTRRNAERTHAARRLWNLDAPHRLRPVCADEQLGTYRRPVVLQVGRQRIDSHPVNARRALVTPDLCQRFPQIVSLDNPLH